MKTKVKKGSKLFRRYLLILCSIVLLTLVVASSIFLTFITKKWTAEQTETLTQNTEIVSQNLKKFVNSYDGDDEYNSKDISSYGPVTMICNTLDTLSDAIDADIFICNTSGEVVLCREMVKNFGSHSSSDGQCATHDGYKISSSIIKQAMSSSGYNDVGTLDGTLESKSIVVATPIVSDGKTIGAVFATKKTESTWSGYMKDTAEMLGIAILAALAIAFVTVYFFTYKTTKPLRQMSEATKHYSDGDFSYKVDVVGNDEIATLSEEFNKMSASLATLESTRRSFVANVSHELKTPMQTIGGFVDGILDGTISDEKREHYLRIISDEVKRLSRLVTGMLNMSKLEAGEMPINYRQFDISDLICRTFLSFEKKIEDNNIEIEGFDKFTPITVMADEDLITQVVYNIADNAVKFTPDNGKINVKAVSDGKEVYVSIRNSGQGISKEEIEKIFERFYKIDKSRSYDVKGAGLGLYIVKNIIKLHGGEIKAFSDEQSYTEFAFHIPINKKA